MSRVMTADPMTEARERINLVSIIEQVRGTTESDMQKLMDTMSAVLTHERGGLQLYEQYRQKTSNSQFREKWAEFGKETRVHEQVAESIIKVLGGDPSYKSSVAKELEKLAGTMMKIEAQGEQADLVRLGNLDMAEHICRQHWRGINKLGRSLKDPAFAKIFWDASRVVERDEDEHVRWHEAMFESQLEKLSAGS